MAKFLAIVGVVGLLVAGTGWVMAGTADANRTDCPGKIVCPLTVEQVCRDRCPVATKNGPAKDALTAPSGLCGGSCPAPQPKPDKPKGGDEKQDTVTTPTGPAPLTHGCCR